MCGIIAALARGASPLPDLTPALDALAHRGPDGRGAFRSPGGRFAAGHVRLALVDPEGGAQPISSEDGAVVAVVNGELYDDERLRAGLLARGHRLKSRCDSELLVHLYQEQGELALRHLRGEFAFVLWDEARQRLWAARDRFGIKPLVYCESPRGLLIASEARALLALGVAPRWDEEAFFQAASLQYLLPGQTLFSGIRSLPPGCLIDASGGSFALRRYWDLDYPIAPADVDDDEAAAELRRRLDEAVSLRMRGDAPAAFQLSGGIDSASVVASAARFERPDAFTVAFGGAYDEALKASEIAAFVGARHHVVDASAEAMASAFVDAVEAGEGLAINGHIAAKFLLMRAVRRAGFKAVLTGEGADEVLAGYAHLRADLAGSHRHLMGSNSASAGLMLPGAEGLDLSAARAALGSAPTWLEAKAGLGLRVRSLLRDDFVARFAGRDPAAALVGAFDLPGQIEGRGPVERSLYLWTHLALTGYILRTLGDAQEMAHGVEGRLPFLDHELFAWLRALPTRSKIRGSTEKFILRRSQAGRLPQAALDREKHPFVAPPLEGPLVSLALDLCASEAGRSSPFFDPLKIERALRSTADPGERKQNDPALYLALSSLILQRRYRLA